MLDFSRGDIRQGIDPLYRLNRRLVMGADLLIRLHAYLQKIAVFMFCGKRETIIIIRVVLSVLSILVGSQLVKELPWCCMQRKHTQEDDSQYLM
jgi:hypothetical protein